MKLNKLFHWLYASVMMLPIVVAPIFAVYSHRHTLTEETQVDIQYKYQSNEINSYDDIVQGNVYYSDNLIISDDAYNYGVKILSYNDFQGYEDLALDSYIKNISDVYNANTNNYIDIYLDIDVIDINFTNGSSFVTVEYYSDGAFLIFNECNFIVYSGLDNFKDVLAANGTDIYISNYNEIEGVDVHDTNSDIMSVFVGNYANAIDKYFNYDNVVNFGNLYSFLNTTFFSGQAPLGFFIFWHLLEYWLLTSLLWLLFDVLIYVPMLVHRWLDKASLS